MLCLVSLYTFILLCIFINPALRHTAHLPASDLLIATALRTHNHLACVFVSAMLLSASCSGEPPRLLTEEAPVMIAEIIIIITRQQ